MSRVINTPGSLLRIQLTERPAGLADGSAAAFQRHLIHVLPVRDRWEVKAQDPDEAEEFYSTRAEAVQNAEALAMTVLLPCELVVHAPDGTVLEHHSYE